MNQLNASFVLYLVIGLMFVGCFAYPSHELIVGDHFDVHDMQGWSPHSMVVDDQGYLWFANSLSSDSLIQLNHQGKHLASLRTTPASSIATIAFGNNGMLYLADNKNRLIQVLTTDKIQIASYIYTIPQEAAIQQLVVDARGTMYIIDDSKTSQVWRMAADGSLLPSVTLMQRSSLNVWHLISTMYCMWPIGSPV